MLTVAYDGSDFRGWAAQPEQRTVQSTLTEAVRRATGEANELTGASRTDSGAHARGQVAHFDTCSAIPISRLTNVLNKLLPHDLRVITCDEVEAEFHSRFGADYRHYRYTVLQTDRDPFRTRFAHCHTAKLDIAEMKRASAALQGEHDFLAFTEELAPEVENTVRTLFDVQADRIDDEIRIDVKGTAFLRGMMRRMAGFLVEVGRGHRPASDAAILLSEDRDRVQWPVVLPAKGLCLMEVAYKPVHTASSDLSRRSRGGSGARNAGAGTTAPPMRDARAYKGHRT